MRGEDQKQTAMYSYVTLTQRIPADHPARQLRALADRALAQLDSEFDKLYAATGRPSIAPRAAVAGHAVDGALLDPLAPGAGSPPQRPRPVAGGPGSGQQRRA